MRLEALSVHKFTPVGPSNLQTAAKNVGADGVLGCDLADSMTLRALRIFDGAGVTFSLSLVYAPLLGTQDFGVTHDFLVTNAHRTKDWSGHHKRRLRRVAHPSG